MTTPAPGVLDGRRRRRLPGLHERRGRGELPRRVRHGAHLRGGGRGGAAHHRVTRLIRGAGLPHDGARRLAECASPHHSHALAGQRRCHSVALWPLAISQRGAAYATRARPPGKSRIIQ